MKNKLGWFTRGQGVTRRLVISATAASIAGVLVAGSAMAADYCISFTAVPSYTLVGKNFSIPSKGNCNAWMGYSPQSNVDSVSSGTGCLSSDGSRFNLTITTTFPGESLPYVEQDGFMFTYSGDGSSLTGTDTYTDNDTGTLGSGGPLAVSWAKCDNNTIP